MTESTHARGQGVEDFSDTIGPVESAHRNAAAGGGNSEARSDSAQVDSTKLSHETYMFGDIHVFVD